jgi:hypothetical protein
MSPYTHYYTEILDKMGVSYDIISWNKFGVEEAGVQAFDRKSKLHKNIVLKIIDYICYCRFVRAKLEAGNYDKVVVFTIVNALMLYSFLKARYKNSYVFDIRDHSIAVKYFGARFSAAIQDAALVVISSAGFKHWLPQNGTYVIRHNTSISRPLDMLANIEIQTKYKILTIGAITYFEANRSLVEQLADSPMFELEFVGSGHAEQMLRDFVASHKIRNVHFRGRYAKQDEPKFLEGAVLIGILIDDSLNSTTCMANRFYLSIVYGIPMMVDENTEQARWVRKYNLGVVIDKKVSIKDQVMRYLQAFDREKFEAGRRASLQIVRQDIEEFEANFKAFLLQ